MHFELFIEFFCTLKKDKRDGMDEMGNYVAAYVQFFFSLSVNMKFY